MAGQTYTKFKVGDRCIIHVNKVNSPTGWWWGVVDSFEWNDQPRGGWGKAEAHITGPLQFKSALVGNGSDNPLYGDDNLTPSVNYAVYAADRDTISLVKSLTQTHKHFEAKVREFEIRIGELRGLIQSLDGVKKAVFDALKEAKTP